MANDFAKSVMAALEPCTYEEIDVGHFTIWSAATGELLAEYRVESHKEGFGPMVYYPMLSVWRKRISQSQAEALSRLVPQFVSEGPNDSTVRTERYIRLNFLENA